MAKSAEELRVEAAEKNAKAARDNELARRAASKRGQEKAQTIVRRPLVTAG